jgi:hypothetical protein
MTPSLKVLRDSLEVVDGFALLKVQRPDCLVEAMIQMILNQCSLGIPDRFLDGIELLGDVETWLSGLDHGCDAPQMPLGALQPFDDIGVTVVIMTVFAHVKMVSPWSGYRNKSFEAARSKSPVASETESRHVAMPLLFRPYLFRLL